MKAHKGPQQPRRPMQAHKEEKGPKRRVWRRLGPRCVFFLIIFLHFVGSSPHQPAARHPPDPSLAWTTAPTPPLATKANAGQRRPTAANEGQCRPTKTKK